jgi:predicted dehydrogenase
MSKKKQLLMSRRAFLAATTTSTVLLGLPLRVNAAEVVPGKVSPNGKLNLAGIGAGGKGMSDIMGCKRENIIALADPDTKRAEEAFYRFKDAKQYTDYRVLLEKHPELDGVIVSTPDHSHAPATYLAMNLNKHVYCQKPLTHTIAEARLISKLAAEKPSLVTQMGNQGHAGDGVRELCEMIWGGAIGQVTEAHIWTNRPIWPQGIAEALPEEPVREGLDWDLWLGPAAARPFNKDYAPFNWRGWWDFGCGAIGDMACHIMDPAFWALKLYDAPGFSIEPIEVEGANAQTAPNACKLKFEVPARGDMGPVTIYWYDGGKVPARPEGVPADEPMGDSDGKNGSLFIGTTGIATSGTYGGDSRLLPASRMAEYTKPTPSIPRVKREDPYLEWTDAIKEGTQPGSQFAYAGPLTEMANFGNIAIRAGKRIEWDSKAFKITNDEAANAMLTKEYRKGWELPC